MAKRRAEPLVWLLFTSGGLAAALLLPVLLVLFGLVFPAGWASAPAEAHLLSVARYPLTRIVLLGLFALPLGAQVPLHALRGTPAQAPQQADHRRLLRRRASGIGLRGLPLAGRPMSQGRLLAIS